MTEATHANLVIVDGVGVLLTGEAGNGKSECSLELITRGHRIVADDVVLIQRNRNILTGQAPEEFAGLIVIRDFGIIDLEQVFGKRSFTPECRIELCVELKKDASPNLNSRIGTDRSEVDILGVSLPHFVLSVVPSRNIAMLVELCVKLISFDSLQAEKDLVAIHDARIAMKP